MKANKIMKSAIKRGLELSAKTPKHTQCTACSGSGYYDTLDNPRCSCCNGSGVQQKVIKNELKNN